MVREPDRVREYESGLVKLTFKGISGPLDAKDILSATQTKAEPRYQIYAKVVDKDGNISYGYSNVRIDQKRPDKLWPIFVETTLDKEWPVLILDEGDKELQKRRLEEIEDAMREAAARGRRAAGGTTQDLENYHVKEFGIWVYSQPQTVLPAA